MYVNYTILFRYQYTHHHGKYAPSEQKCSKENRYGTGYLMLVHEVIIRNEACMADNVTKTSIWCVVLKFEDTTESSDKEEDTEVERKRREHKHL